MSNLAALSSQLRQKDSDKTAILNAIKDLKALKEQQVAGQLCFTVTSISGVIMQNCSVDIKISPSEANVGAARLNNLAIGTEIELLLTTKSVVLEITCVSECQSETCTATFDLNDAPDNNSMSTQLEASSLVGISFEMHVKATYDTVDGLMESKVVELREVESEIKRIADELRGASAVKKAPTAKAKKEKQIPRRREPESDIDVDDNADTGAGSGILQTISSGFWTGAGMMLQHKAVVAFGIAAYAIFAYGEAMSV